MPTLSSGYTYEDAPAIAWPTPNIRRQPDITIGHTLGQPSDCQFDVGKDTPTDTPPEVGESVEIRFGTGPTLLQGEIESTTQTYEERNDQLKWTAQVTDTSRLFNRKLPIVCYENTSANTVIAALVAAVPGFTTTFVEAGLPNVTVQFDGSKTRIQCLEEIAAQIGDTHFYLEGFDLHFFTGVDPSGAPAVIHEGNTDLLSDPPITFTEDITQLRTRVFGRGASAKLIADALAGDTTLFVDSNDLFDASGGDLFIGPCQIVSYTGKSVLSIPQYRPGGSGGFLAVADNTFAGEAYGVPTVFWFESVIKYRCSYVKGGIESTPADASVTLDRNTSPTPFNVIQDVGGAVENGQTYTYYMTTVDDNGHESEFTGGGTNVTVNAPFNAASGTTLAMTADARVNHFNLYRSTNSGPFAGMIFFVFSIDVNANPTLAYPWFDGFSSASLTNRRTDFETALVNGWVVPGTMGGKVNLTVPLGPSGTTARKIYRSDDNGATYYLRTTISDNVTVAFADSAANEFAVNFDFGGTNTWVESSANQSPGNLPSLQKAVLTGVTGITEDIRTGSDVALWVQVDDLVAQATIAEKEGGDGVHEYLLTDTSLDTYAKLTARANIELQLYAYPLKSVNFGTRDREMKVGRLVTFDLPTPRAPGKGIFGTFLIQTVHVDQIHVNDELIERYVVSASAARFTLQDLIQRVALLQDNGSTPITGFTGGGGGGGGITTSVTEAELAFTDITTGDVTSVKHGLAPKSLADATKFLNSAATPAYAQVKDSDLATTDITTNNVTIAKHGFTPKLPNDATKFLNGTGGYTTPPGTGGAMLRVLAANTSVAAGTSQVIAESLEIGAGVILEIESGALLEITGGTGPVMCGSFVLGVERTNTVTLNISNAGTVDWLVVNATTNPIQSGTNPPTKFIGPQWLLDGFAWSLTGAATVSTNNDDCGITTNAGDSLLSTALAAQVTSGVVFTSTGALYGLRLRIPCQRRKLILRFQVLTFSCIADLSIRLSNNAIPAQTYRITCTPGGGQVTRQMFKVAYFGLDCDLIIALQNQSTGLTAGANPNVGVHGLWITEVD